MTAGRVERDGVQADGIADVLAIDQKRNPALARRRIEGHRRRVQRGEQRPGRSCPAGASVASNASSNAANAIVVLVTKSTRRRGKPIGDDAGQRREQQDRDRPRRADDAEIERRSMRRAGHLRDEESHRGELHPRAEIRDQQTEPEQPEVAIAQRRENRRSASEADCLRRWLPHASRARTAATISAAHCAGSNARRVDAEIVVARIAERQPVPISMYAVRARSTRSSSASRDVAACVCVGARHASDAPLARRVHEDAQRHRGRAPKIADAPRPTMTTLPRAAYSRTASCTRAQQLFVERLGRRRIGELRRRAFEAGEEVARPSVGAASSFASTASGLTRNRFATTTGSWRSTYS